MLAAGVPIGAGTDATRVASFNPWMSLYWLSTGRTIGGLQLYPESHRLDRTEALQLWTTGSAWFSGESGQKGSIRSGEYADLAVLSADYFSIADEEIKDLHSVLTLVGGRIVHGDQEFSGIAPPSPPVSPSWSPVSRFGGHYVADGTDRKNNLAHRSSITPTQRHRDIAPPRNANFWGPIGCGCFAI